jgi:hypothetical protein
MRAPAGRSNVTFALTATYWARPLIAAANGSSIADSIVISNERSPETLRQFAQLWSGGRPSALRLQLKLEN